MNNNKEIKTFIIGLSLVIGLSLLGFFIFKGLKTLAIKTGSHRKGLAEMEMKAESATMNLSFSFSSDYLQDLIRQTENKRKQSWLI